MTSVCVPIAGDKIPIHPMLRVRKRAFAGTAGQSITEPRSRYLRHQWQRIKPASTPCPAVRSPVDNVLDTRLYAATDPDHFLDVVQAHLFELGLSDFIYQPLHSENQAVPWGRYPSQMWLRYCREPGHRLLLRHARISSGTALRSEIDTWLAAAPLQGDWLDRHRLLNGLLDEFGYHEYGALIPEAAAGQCRALFWVASRGTDANVVRQRLQNHRQCLEELARSVHAVAQRRFAAEFGMDHVGMEQAGMDHAGMEQAPPQLGGRPLRLLEVLAQNNITLGEAASRLHISISTANQHIAAAKKILGARTTVHAVTTAVRQGLIRL